MFFCFFSFCLITFSFLRKQPLLSVWSTQTFPWWEWTSMWSIVGSGVCCPDPPFQSCNWQLWLADLSHLCPAPTHSPGEEKPPHSRSSSFPRSSQNLMTGWCGGRKFQPPYLLFGPLCRAIQLQSSHELSRDLLWLHCSSAPSSAWIAGFPPVLTPSFSSKPPACSSPSLRLFPRDPDMQQHFSVNIKDCSLIFYVDYC